MKILVVAANEKLKKQVKQHLVRLNYDVITAALGNEGFLKFQNKKPDLVIIDIILTSST